MADKNHGPVTMPAGSYDLEKLQKGLDKAVDSQAKNYDAEVGKALDGARSDEIGTTPPHLVPGNKFVEVDGPGGTKETVQVFDPKKADEQRAASSDHGIATPAANEGAAAAPRKGE